MKTITGYKAFDANLKCRDFQYEIGKEYDTDTVKICETGFHFCERAIDVFNYYLPSSRFCIVTGWGTIDREDNKVAVSNIRIEKEITLHELIEATVNSTVGAVSNSGNYGAASNSGDRGAASNSGDRGVAMSVGTCSSVNTNAKDSVAAVFGYDCKASGSLGSWIVLTERNDLGEILDIRSAKIDGINLLPNTLYQLKNGIIL